MGNSLNTSFHWNPTAFCSMNNIFTYEQKVTEHLFKLFQGIQQTSIKVKMDILIALSPNPRLWLFWIFGCVIQITQRAHVLSVLRPDIFRGLYISNVKVRALRGHTCLRKGISSIAEGHKKGLESNCFGEKWSGRQAVCSKKPLGQFRRVTSRHWLEWAREQWQGMSLRERTPKDV